MPKIIDPLKIELLIPTPMDLKGIKEVTALDIMEGFTKNFHPNGLFSTQIFGKVGEERRSNSFAYINLNVPIFHPLIFKVLLDLKELYGEVIAGKAYAVFDEATKDLVKSNVAEGETGYAFFVSQFAKLKFQKSGSITRDLYVDFIEMHRSNPFIEQLVIMPAGFRDYTIDENGKPSEDEINGMYRSIMAIAGNIENISYKLNPEFIDASRCNLQVKVLELYRYIVGLVFGKHKRIQGSFLSRKVSNTTRNVASSYIPMVRRFGDESSTGPNDVVLGLYQFLRDIMPLTVYRVRNKYGYLIFSGANTNMTVVDAKTLKSKQVPVSSKAYNTWMTYDGIEKVCVSYGQEAIRHYPVKIDNDYLGLIYKGPDNTFKFLQDIDDVPAGRDKKDVSPITLAEYLYICVVEESIDSAGFSTRYPITGFGSTYPGPVNLRTTSHSEVRKELDDNWEPTGVVAKAFPIRGERFFDSMAVAVSKMKRLGLDHDGDQGSHYCVMTEEARREVKRITGSRDHYLNLDGSMAFSQANDVINLALSNLYS